jgi:hypothetical protein
MTRWLISLACVLCVSAPLQAQTWTSVDYDSIPADNGINDGTTVTIDTANIVGEATGDLLILACNSRSTTSSMSVTTDGGTTWTAYAAWTHTVSTSVTARVFWALVDSNGLTGDLVVTDGGTGVNSMSCAVATFHASSGTIAQDVALATDNNDAVPGTPADVTVAEVITQTNNALVVAFWFSSDDNTWVLQTAWTNPQGVAMTRNIGTTDHSLSMAYTTVATAGGSGTVTNRQTVNNPDATIHGAVAFKATGGAAALPSRVIGGGIIRPGRPGGE